MPYSLTILGRSSLLLASGLLANAICWVVAAILFVPKSGTRPLLSLALLAWTLGLRHALDADHISAIDNVTRGLINLGQLPVTCGLFFSLGHSTIVLVVTIVIAVSSGVYDNLNSVSEVGGVIGAAVSGSFLFIVGLANSIILWRILKKRKKQKEAEQRNQAAGDAEKTEEEPIRRDGSLMMRIIGPVITFVNRPWKMYPVGLLFGLGFDTASSIALISISAIAKKTTDGTSFPSSYIIILPLLFAAGMVLLDSADSVIMLYSYTNFPERSWRLIEKKPTPANTNNIQDSKGAKAGTDADVAKDEKLPIEVITPVEEDPEVARVMAVKTNVMSGLSIVLTILSILVAFSISIITLMSLIGERCSQCVAAAEAKDGGGLAGSWWRGWARAADQSGWIGIGIVGIFIVIVGGWYLVRWIIRRRSQKDSAVQEAET